MSSASRGRPTIRQIAVRAGVSVASVSRVLNGLGGGPDTVRRVQRAARELGYAPNSVARWLRSRRTGQIGVAVPDLADPASAALVREIQAAAGEAGYRLLLHSTHADAASELALLRELAQGYADGLVLHQTWSSEAHVAELARLRTPVVVIGSVPEEAGTDSVVLDAAEATRIAVEHLYAAGCRQIGLVTGPSGTVAGQASRAGHTRALVDLGLADEERPSGRLVESVDVQRAAGARATERLLARSDVDAIICGSDLVALGALHALRSAGRDVPQDVAVVAMDDTDLAQIALPSLTSVSFGAEECGRGAAELLFQRIAEPAAPPRQVRLVARLVLRESTRTDELLEELGLPAP